MKDTLTKKLLIGLGVSIAIMLLGYFLWEDRTPVPDAAQLSVEEIVEIQAQTETSTLSSIGALFLNVGFVGAAVSLGTIVIRQIIAFFKKGRS